MCRILLIGMKIYMLMKLLQEFTTHNLTINAYNISQFENHIRAVCSLKQITLEKISNAKMINLIGDQIVPYRKNFKLNENEFFFDYLKRLKKKKNGSYNNPNLNAKSIEGNFDNPEVNELLTKHFIELRAASPKVVRMFLIFQIKSFIN